jgi:nucleotidyltransferase substrate binding protein (TIGR01987 family)
MSEDVRWKQRFGNFEKAMAQLTEAIELSRQRALTKLEEQGLIQGFEYAHELSWKTMKDYLLYQGPVEITGSRDAVREAYKRGLVADGHVWMEMIKGRNLSSHTYDQTAARQLVDDIVNRYFLAFQQFQTKMLQIMNDQG